MALTIRERIAVDLATRLAAIVGVTVVRAPIDDFDEEELPAIGLFMGDETSEDGMTSFITVNRAEVLIAGHAKGATGAAAESAAHDLAGKAEAAALADHTLGGLAINARKTALLVVLNQNSDGEIPLCGFELSLEVEYWTVTDDPTALAPD